MSIKQTAFGRRARSVCIVTDLAVRLQDKQITVCSSIETKVVWTGSAKVTISQSATGEITIVIEPP